MRPVLFVVLRMHAPLAQYMCTAQGATCSLTYVGLCASETSHTTTRRMRLGH